MGLARKYFEHLCTAPERDIEPEKLNGLQRYWYVLKNNLWGLILLNLVFTATSIPVVTIPMSISAMSRICMKYLLGQRIELFRDYFMEWKRAFGRSWVIILCGAAMIALLTLACFAYYYLLSGAALYVFLILSQLLALWVFSLLCYAFSFQAASELRIGELLKNAVLVSVTEFGTTVLLILLPGVAYFLCALFFPLTLPLLMLGLISLTQLAVCTITLKPIKKYTIS